MKKFFQSLTASSSTKPKEKQYFEVVNQPPLPPGWVAYKDRLGRTFYWHQATSTSSWTPPSMNDDGSTTAAAANDDRPLPPGWEKRYSNGRAYYVDHNTRRTQWQPPTQQQRADGASASSGDDETSSGSSGEDDADALPPPRLASACAACGTQFGAIEWRQHCRRCGNAFCSACTRQRAPLPRHGLHAPVRVCDACYLATTNGAVVDAVDTLAAMGFDYARQIWPALRVVSEQQLDASDVATLLDVIDDVSQSQGGGGGGGGASGALPPSLTVSSDATAAAAAASEPAAAATTTTAETTTTTTAAAAATTTTADRPRFATTMLRVRPPAVSPSQRNLRRVSSLPSLAMLAAAAAAADADAAACTDSGLSTPAPPPNADICIICWDSPFQVLFLECAHICSCSACAVGLKNCPICRRKIDRVVQFYKV